MEVLNLSQTQANKLIQSIGVLYRRKWYVIIPALAGLIIGSGVALSLPRFYRSATLILVEQQQVSETYVTPTDKTPFIQKLNTIRQQIMSRSNLEKIVNDFNLYKRPENSGVLKKTVLGAFGLIASGKEEALDRMAKDIDIKVLGDRKAEDAFSITYTGTNPYVTMQVTNALASLFIEQSLKVREQYAEGTSDFLSNELDSAKKDLEELEKSVRTYKERNMGSLPQQLDANLRTLDRYQVDFQAASLELKAAEERKLLLEEQLGQGPGGIIIDPQETELAKLEDDLSNLLSQYTENYPDVIITKNRIAELKAKISRSKVQSGAVKRPANPKDAQLVATLAQTNAQISTLRERITEIRRHIKGLERRVETTPANEQKFSDLRRDYDISLRNYQALLEKKLSARLAENLEKRQKGERFRVIDPANLPERPIWPNRPLLVLYSSGVGLGIGLAIVYLLEFMNPAFRSKDEVETDLDLPVLSVVPAVEQDGQAGTGSILKRLRPGALPTAPFKS